MDRSRIYFSGLFFHPGRLGLSKNYPLFFPWDVIRVCIVGCEPIEVAAALAYRAGKPLVGDLLLFFCGDLEDWQSGIGFCWIFHIWVRHSLGSFIDIRGPPCCDGLGAGHCAIVVVEFF